MAKLLARDCDPLIPVSYYWYVDGPIAATIEDDISSIIDLTGDDAITTVKLKIIKKACLHSCYYS